MQDFSFNAGFENLVVNQMILLLWRFEMSTKWLWLVGRWLGIVLTPLR